jgi:tetratricopeptide (TPR) repeat protein
MKEKPPAWVVPFERNPRFVDREILGQLKRTIFSSNHPRRIAIHGLGGVGKTQIVLELAHQTRERWPECSIFWIPAINRESIQQAYREIASELRLESFASENEDPRALVQRHLNQHHSGQWLIIFDNADDMDPWVDSSPSAKDGLKNYLPRSDRGTVLFTTRSRRVAHHLASSEIISIPEMDEERATAVLRNSLVNKDLLKDKDTTHQLLQQLTFLPLAIVQAGAFINQNETDIAGYIRILDGQEQDAINLLSEDFEDEGRYQSIRNPIANTWLVSFQSLVKQNKLAGDLISLMACISTRDIPIAFLPRPSQLELEKAIGALSSYSFIKVRTTDNLIDMHRLVQLAMRNWLNHLNQLSSWQISAATLLIKHTQDIDGAEITHLQARRTLMPHAIYLLESTSGNHGDYVWSELTYWASRYLYVESGRISEATKYCLEVIDITEKLGGDEWTVTRNKSLLSQLKTEQEKYEEAEILGMEALQSSEKVNGLSSIPTAHLTLSLAVICMGLGRLDEALNYCRQSLKIYLQLCGPFHSNTLSCITTMGQLYIRSGRLVNAKDLAQQQVIILTELYGPDHPLTLSTQSTQARIYYDLWKLKEAAELEEKVFDKCCKISGPEHPQTLGVMRSLAVTWRGQNRDDEAFALMAECARLSEKSLGRTHGKTKIANDYLDSWRKPQ